MIVKPISQIGLPRILKIIRKIIIKITVHRPRTGHTHVCKVKIFFLNKKIYCLKSAIEQYVFNNG